MNLSQRKLRLFSILAIPAITLLFVSPVVASGAASTLPTGKAPLHVSSPFLQVSLLDPSFNPNSPVGGVPFCSSGSLGTILCLSPSYLKTAYGFPSFGNFGLTGHGSTIVIVDAFGSPTLQSDLNTFDATFGIPATTVTILCGPTWTGSATDDCPVKTVADFNTVGNTPAGQSCGGPAGVEGWAEETSLDVAMSHSLAPGAKIVVVVANDCFDSSLYGAESAVVAQHKYDGSIMSQSFGEPDDLVTCTALDPTGTYCAAFDPTLLNLPNTVFQAAEHHHWTVIASSGDDGANENARVLLSGELTPSFPATSPLVLAAGGTQGNPYGGQYGAPPGPGGTESCPAFNFCNIGLVVINGGLNGCGTAARPGEPSSCIPVKYGGEAAWNEFNTFGIGTSTGGGVSALYSRPSYQSGTPDQYTTLLGNTVQATGRTTPDVAFNSAIQGGFLVYLGFLGVWGVFGGTSASSPAWAAIMAILDQAHGGPVGFINPAIYKLGESQSSSGFHWFGSAFHDITSGENSDTQGAANPIATYYGLPTVCPPPLNPSPTLPLSSCVLDGFTATHGYDLTTGWGTPNVSLFIFQIQQFLHGEDGR